MPLEIDFKAVGEFVPTHLENELFDESRPFAVGYAIDKWFSRISVGTIGLNLVIRW